MVVLAWSHSGAEVVPPSQVWSLKEYKSHCVSDMSTILLVSNN